MQHTATTLFCIPHAGGNAAFYAKFNDFFPSWITIRPLELPGKGRRCRERLLTSMESHQKSFGIEGATGELLPHFLTVLNITPEDMGVVKRGWERVLRARLEDARFFWQAATARI